MRAMIALAHPLAMVLALAVVLVHTPRVAQAQDVDREKLLADDRALWADVMDVEGQHAAHPTGWTHIEEKDAGVALSFPCKPERQAQTVEDRTVVQFLCAVGQRGYIAQFEERELDNAVSKLAFLVSATANIADKLRESGLDVKVVPVHHLTYGDARGRQSRIETEELVMELRALIRPGGTVLLGVRDVPGGLPGNMPQFFDSLELR